VRIDARNAFKRGMSFASETAIETYSCSVEAINDFNPFIRERKDTPTLCAWFEPRSVTTGTYCVRSKCVILVLNKSYVSTQIYAK